MVNEEKIKKCAIQVLEKLNYDIEETVPFVEGSIQISEKTEFSVIFNLGKQEFEPKHRKQIEDPELKRCLDVLNRHLKECLKTSLKSA